MAYLTRQSKDSQFTQVTIGASDATVAMRLAGQVITMYGGAVITGGTNTLTLTASSGVTVSANLVCTAGATFGGGYGSTGVTISTAGVIQANGAITTDGALTADSATIGGGYGSTGVTISTLGIIQTNGAITTDAALTAESAVIGGGYGSTGASISAGGEISTNNNIIADGLVQVGSTATAALKLGGGTSSSPLATSTADKNFGGFWSSSTATSGDSRGLYWRHYLGGTIATTGYGDAIRPFMTVTGTGYTAATGVHSTCQINAAASVTGLGVGVRGTLAVASTVAQGTLAAIMAEVSNSATVSATEMSFLRLTEASTGTKAPYFAILDGVDTSDLFVGNTGAVNKGLKIKVNGTAYWIMLSAATS